MVFCGLSERMIMPFGLWHSPDLFRCRITVNAPFSSGGWLINTLRFCCLSWVLSKARISKIMLINGEEEHLRPDTSFHGEREMSPSCTTGQINSKLRPKRLFVWVTSSCWTKHVTWERHPLFLRFIEKMISLRGEGCVVDVTADMWVFGAVFCCCCSLFLRIALVLGSEPKQLQLRE